MSDNTAIEWTDATWNPFVGCEIESPGCINCYAMRMAARIEAMNAALRAQGKNGAPHYDGTTKMVKGKAVWTGKLALAPEHILTEPLRWKRPRRIFVNSMSDLFAENVPDEWIDKVFAVMALAPQHTFQVLTKRAKRMREYVNGVREMRRVAMPDGSILRFGPWAHVSTQMGAGKRWPLPNVWLGVSAEDQARADERIPDLLATPAAVRWVSAEPLLGPIDFRRIMHRDPETFKWLSGGAALLNTLTGNYPLEEGFTRDPHPDRLHWIVAGGESGRGARPMHPAWPRSIRDQCAAAGVPFLFKQWGAWLDADQLFDRIDRGPSLIIRDGEPWRPARPLNFSDAAFLANLLSHPFEHHSDGSTMFRLDKARSGRLLDGVEHNGFPEAR